MARSGRVAGAYTQAATDGQIRVAAAEPRHNREGLTSPTVTADPVSAARPAANGGGHQVAEANRATVDAALEVLLGEELEPIVDMVLTRRDDRYEALSRAGADRVPAGRDAGHVGGPRDRRRRPARRPVDRPVHPARRRAGPSRTRRGRPTRTPTPSTRSRSCSTRRPRPTSASCIRPRTTGRTRAGIAASTDRSASSSPARHWCSPARAFAAPGSSPRAAAPRRRRADDRRAPRLHAPRQRSVLRHPGRNRPRRARSSRTRVRVTSSASSSTARTPTCSTTWPRAARHPTSRA